jgi:hypothetical protein
MVEFHFRSMEAPQNKTDVIILFLVSGLFITLPEFFIYFVPFKSYLRFHVCAMVTICFQFLGENLTPESFVANLDTPKRHYPEKICVN